MSYLRLQNKITGKVYDSRGAVPLQREYIAGDAHDKSGRGEAVEAIKHYETELNELALADVLYDHLPLVEKNQRMMEFLKMDWFERAELMWRKI